MLPLLLLCSILFPKFPLPLSLLLNVLMRYPSQELEDWTSAELAQGPLPVHLHSASEKMASMTMDASKVWKVRG